MSRAGFGTHRQWGRARLVALVGVVAAITALASACGSGSSTASGNQTVLIGATLPLTGPIGPYGKSMLQGLQLGLQDSQKSLTGVTLKLNALDDAGNAAPAVTQARQLMSSGAMAVVSATAIPLAQLALAQQYKVPLLNGGGNIPDLEGHDWLFNDAFMQTEGGAGMMRYAFNSLGIKNFAIVLTSDYPQATGTALQDIWRGISGQTAPVYFIPIDTTDAGPYIDKALSTHPDGLYFAVTGTALELTLTQMQQRGVNIPVLAGDGALLAAPEANKVTFPIYYANPGQPASANLASEYKTAYSSDPDFLTVQFYNLGLILGQSVGVLKSQGKALTGANLQALLNNTNQKFVGDGGIQMSFDSKHVAAQPVEIVKVTAGQSTVVATKV